VFLVDDDVPLSEAFSSLLRSIGFDVKLYSSAQEFLAAARGDALSCLVLDVQLPGLSGLDLQRELRRSGQEIPVIFISGHGDIPMTVRAMKAGAVEFLQKPVREQELLDAIQYALEEDRTRRVHRAEIDLLRARSAKLTQREREVMARLLESKLNKQVAAELGVTEITVKVHRRHIMEKMQASSLVDLARMVAKLES
jgi:FixJ family two-component response regulator